MSFDCLTVMKKDLDELLRNRYIVSSMATFPLLFSVIIPLLYLLTMPEKVSSTDVASLGHAVDNFASLTPKQAMISFLVQSNLPFYLLMPGIMPTLIAAYSIAGEKKNGTLEPMLATPVTNWRRSAGQDIGRRRPCGAAHVGIVRDLCTAGEQLYGRHLRARPSCPTHSGRSRCSSPARFSRCCPYTSPYWYPPGCRTCGPPSR